MGHSTPGRTAAAIETSNFQTWSILFNHMREGVFKIHKLMIRMNLIQGRGQRNFLTLDETTDQYLKILISRRSIQFLVA